MTALKTAAAIISVGFFQQASAVQLYASIERDGNTFKLSDHFSTSAVEPPEKFLPKVWFFKAGNLDPAFATKRFECVINNKTKTDGCAAWRNQEESFVHINMTPSSYGDTPEVRREKNQRKISAAGVAVGAAGAALVGVVYGPTFVVLSPLYLLGKAVEKETKKWVEFDHIEFLKAQEAAIKNAGFESKEEFFSTHEKAEKILDSLEKKKSDALNLLKERVSVEAKILSRYMDIGLKAESYPFHPKPFLMPELPISKRFGDFELAVSQAIDEHYEEQYKEFSSALAEDAVRLAPLYAEKLNQNKIAAEERRKEDERAKAERLKNEKIVAEQQRIAIEQQRQLIANETARQNKFRKALKIGDDTFCGPVIETRQPMIKIAVNAQLQGFASEAWLKSSQVFTPEYGCRNVNGRLSPIKTDG